MKLLFSHHHTIRLPETDAAGILFHGQLFTITHNTHEEMLTAVGLPVHEILNHHPFSLVVAHVEADFHHPLLLGEALTLEVYLKRAGTSSFTVQTRFSTATPSAQLKAEVTTVYVTIDKASGGSTPLPAALQQLLSNG